LPAAAPQRSQNGHFEFAPLPSHDHREKAASELLLNESALPWEARRVGVERALSPRLTGEQSQKKQHEGGFSGSIGANKRVGALAIGPSEGPQEAEENITRQRRDDVALQTRWIGNIALHVYGSTKPGGIHSARHQTPL
jgi:hypothetical protein